jgi:hypothetical protein
MPMNQMLFEWHERSDVKELERVELESKTIETVIGLMMDALIAVVRDAEHAEEAADER